MTQSNRKPSNKKTPAKKPAAKKPAAKKALKRSDAAKKPAASDSTNVVIYANDIKKPTLRKRVTRWLLGS